MSALPPMASGDGAAHGRHELHAGDPLLAMYEGDVLRGATRFNEPASNAEANEGSVNLV
jgi:hypothetical protein